MDGYSLGLYPKLLLLFIFFFKLKLSYIHGYLSSAVDSYYIVYTDAYKTMLGVKVQSVSPPVAESDIWVGVGD